MDNPSKEGDIVSERAWKILALVLLIWAVVITSLYANDVVLAKLQGSGEYELISVNIGFKYKDGRVEWHNLTKVPVGSTLLEVTTKVAKVNYTTYKSIGAFVESINGVKNEKPYYWMWWYWSSSTGWTLGPVAADKYIVSDGEILMWYYQDTSGFPLAKP